MKRFLMMLSLPVIILTGIIIFISASDITVEQQVIAKDVSHLVSLSKPTDASELPSPQ